MRRAKRAPRIVADVKNPTAEDIAIAESVAKLGGRKHRLRCPVCGTNYLTGSDHPGSKLCEVRTHVHALHARGWLRVRSNEAFTLRELGIPVEFGPYAMRHISYGPQLMSVEVAPKWAVRTIAQCRGGTNHTGTVTYHERKTLIKAYKISGKPEEIEDCITNVFIASLPKFQETARLFQLHFTTPLCEAKRITPELVHRLLFEFVGTLDLFSAKK